MRSLIDPEDDSALFYVQEALRLDPEQRRRAGSARCARRYGC